MTMNQTITYCTIDNGEIHNGNMALVDQQI